MVLPNLFEVCKNPGKCGVCWFMLKTSLHWNYFLWSIGQCLAAQIIIPARNIKYFFEINFWEAAWSITHIEIYRYIWRQILVDWGKRISQKQAIVVQIPRWNNHILGSVSLFRFHVTIWIFMFMTKIEYFKIKIRFSSTMNMYFCLHSQIEYFKIKTRFPVTSSGCRTLFCTTGAFWNPVNNQLWLENK